MKLLFISHDHALLPFAWRAKRQGAEVEVLIANARYQHAWDGRLAKLDVPRNPELHGSVRELVVEHGYTVLTDSREWSATLADIPHVFGVGPSEPAAAEGVDVAVGAWWTGSAWTHAHLVLTENGLWTGGQGPAMPAAALLVYPSTWREEWSEALSTLQDRLKAASFRGLVRVKIDPSAPSNPLGFDAGWPFLHTHALLAAQGDSIAELLDGREPTAQEAPYRLVLPVSVPPWPHRLPRREEPRPVSFPRDLTRWMFWHDIAIEGEEMRTAGLGGLVAVARGVGRTVTGTRRMAVSLAEQLVVGEKQYRVDAGGMADAMWTHLVENGMV